MGPLVRRAKMSSQLTSRKKGWALTRPAPPLMLPSRRERSMVQKERMRSLASSEMGGSWGKRTGFSTILWRRGSLSASRSRAASQILRRLTACISQWDFDARKVDNQ